MDFSQGFSGENMWELNSGFQIVGFLCALLLGGIFSFFYDILKSIRLSFKPRSAIVFIIDILFFTTIALVIFFYLLASTSGEVRIYILIGCLIGFFLTRVLLSKFICFLFVFVFKKIITFYRVLSNGFYAFFERFSAWITSALKKVRIFLKNSEKTLEKEQ